MSLPLPFGVPCSRLLHDRAQAFASAPIAGADPVIHAYVAAEHIATWHRLPPLVFDEDMRDQSTALPLSHLAL